MFHSLPEAGYRHHLRSSCASSQFSPRSSCRPSACPSPFAHRYLPWRTKAMSAGQAKFAFVALLAVQGLLWSQSRYARVQGDGPPTHGLFRRAWLESPSEIAAYAEVSIHHRPSSQMLTHTPSARRSNTSRSSNAPTSNPPAPYPTPSSTSPTPNPTSAPPPPRARSPSARSSSGSSSSSPPSASPPPTSSARTSGRSPRRSGSTRASRA